jgi:Domain of Unknown Function (DUF928)
VRGVDQAVSGATRLTLPLPPEGRRGSNSSWARTALVAVAVLLAPAFAVGQNPPAAPPARQPEASPPPAYKPPLRGAPGGRVGGASRGTIKVTAPLPTIDLLAPADHAGLTTSTAPALYFYVSRRVNYPTRLTISAPKQPVPIIEATIPSPPAPGIYAVRLGDYRIRLEPGIVYTWSISAILNPSAPSRNIVASASLLCVPSGANSEDAARAPPERRAALLAASGLWYDAIAAAAELGQQVAIDALMSEVGLTRPAAGPLQSSAVTQ